MVSTDCKTEGTNSFPSEGSLPKQPPGPGHLIFIASESDDESNSPKPPSTAQKMARRTRQRQKQLALLQSASIDRSTFGDGQRKQGNVGIAEPSAKKKRQQCKEQQQNVIQIVTASKAKKEAQKRSVTETMTSSQAKKEGVTRKKKGKKPAEEVGQGTCKITRKEGQEEQEEDVRMSREFYSQFCEERDAGFMELKNVIQKTFNDTVSEVITALGLRQQ